MFGKKSSSGAKSKPKKSVKQGPKVNFFAAHAEKLVLALVVGLLGFLIYEGVGGKGYDQSRQPPQLAEKATSISNNIKNGDPWPAIKDTVPAEHSYTPKTEAARQPTDDRIYGTFPMGGAGGQPFVKRGDPVLMAPIKIVGQSVMGLIAVEATDEFVDPFEEFEDAVKLKGKGAGNNNKKNNQRMEGNAMGDQVGGGGMMGDMGGGMGGMGGGLKRFFPTKYNHGFSLGGGAGGMGGMGDMMGGGMGGMGDMMGGGMDGGAGGMMGGGAGGMMGGAPGGAAGGTTTGLNGTVRPKPKKFKAETLLFNAVTALVPHEEMLKEYEAKLRDSADYNPMRDKPIYLDFEYERSEVIPGQPDNWKAAGSAVSQLNMMKKWLPAKPQTIPEVIDLTSADRALTMPIPPLLFQDYRKFAKHPDIDWIWDAGMNNLPTQVPTPDANQTDNTDQLLPGERPMAAGGMGGMMGGMGGGGDMMGGGMGGAMGGMGDMMGGGMGGGMGDMMGGGMGGAMGGMGDMMGGGMGGGIGGMGDMMGGGMGGGMGDMMSGGMGGMMGGGMNYLPAKYKMIRFYDPLKPTDIGKTFKYRIRLKMEDPNYPSDRFKAPPDNDLEAKVFERVNALRMTDDPIVEKYRQENIKARQVAIANKTMPKLKFHTRAKLLTPWSDASKGIYVRGFDDVYVHKMAKRSEVEAVIVRLDDKKNAYVPMYFFFEDEEALKKQAEDREKDKDAKAPKFAKPTIPAFKRGAVLAIQSAQSAFTTSVAHPITNVLKRWVNYDEFGFTKAFARNDKSWNTVVDIRGGDPLAGNKAQEDPLTDNVEMMMLMSDLRVQVSNEFDDTPQYRGFTLSDEREAAEKGGNGMNMGGMGGGMDGGGGMMGGGGKG